MQDPKPDLRQQVRDLLTEISEKGLADGVADALRARGIKGQMDSTCSCPIAKLILALPGVDVCDVDNGTIEVWATGSALPFEVIPPLPVSNFVYLFDEGVYLDLVEVAS